MKRRRFSIFAVIVIFILQIILPTVNIRAAGTDISGVAPFITDVNITDANGNNLGDNINKSSEIHINFTWSVPDSENIGQGDFYTMQLPDQINIVAAIDQPLINPDNGSIVANMHIDTNGKVTITFTDSLNGLKNRHGGFYVDCHFDKDKIGNTNPVYIDFDIPAKGTITVGPYNFQQPDPSVVKDGSYDASTDEITWTITVNKEGVRLDNAVIQDDIGSGQEFVDKSVNKTEYTYDASSKKLVVNLGNITTQQVITYKTSVHSGLAAKAQGTYTYDNKAVLNYEDKSTAKSITSNTASVPVNVKYISKDGKYNSATKSIDWTITVNESGRTINNAVVMDTIPAGLTLEPSSVIVNGSYTVSGQDVTFTLGDINSKQTITFSTAVDPAIYNSNNSTSYSNTAKLSGEGVPAGAVSNKTIDVNSSIIEKKGTGYDASKGIITWLITVNNNKTSVASGAVVTDDIPIGQTYVAGSAVLDNSTSIDDSSYTEASSGDTLKTGTFTYTFSNAFSDTHTIKFQTQVTNPKAYRANYEGNYINNVNLYAAGINQATSASETVNSEIINKTGNGYNYATREITWKIVVNKNKMPITNAVITDNIPAGQQYVINSAAIDNGAPAGGFTYANTEGDSLKTGVLVYRFPKGSSNTIHDTYTITFKTKLSDLSVFNSSGTKKINNTASISGDEIPDDGNRQSVGTQDINNNVIDKKPTYIQGNAYIDWTLNINQNYSINMDGATVTDNLQDGLALNTDTVELYKAVVNPDGSLSASDKVVLTSENVKYDISTREFKFTFPKDSGTSAFILKFTTDVTKAGDYSNTVEFKGQGSSGNASGAQHIAWFSTGGGWGVGTSGSITILKIDGNNSTKVLSGAVFQLIDQYGNVKETAAPTGNDGKIVFKNLKFDTNYSLKEITPPVGYSLSNDVYKFQVHNATGEKDINYNFQDIKIRKDIDFKKLGEDGKGLQGAEFTLYDNDGVSPVKDSQNKNVTAVSDKDGNVIFNNVEYGNYKIKESRAPAGYLLSNSVLSASFSGDYKNAFVTVTPDSVSNTRIRGGIIISKIDAYTFVPLQRAGIAVYTSDGKQVTSSLTGATGTVEFDNLYYGDYYYLETEAPRGYQLDTKKHPFSIKEDGVIIEDKFFNTKIKATIEIRKTDNNGRLLQGAEFTLYNDSNIAIATAISDKNGIASFNSVEYGSYTIKETKAPEGYYLNNAVIKANVKSLETQSFIVKDDRIQSLPKTGGVIDTPIMIIAGLLNIIAGIGFTYKKSQGNSESVN